MGASKRKQMSSFSEDWADQIWSAVEAMNGGQGAAWRLPVAVLAVTGCRPAALEAGVRFSLVEDKQGRRYVEATIRGVKIAKNRGQPEHRLRWSADADTHRLKELRALVRAMMNSPGKSITVNYDAEAISTRLRELSKKLWPRRRYAVTGYCYRHLFSATAKGAGVSPTDLAAALGHQSAESQGAYARAGRVKTASRRPFASAEAPIPVRVERSPMARFKASMAIKKAKLRRSI